MAQGQKGVALACVSDKPAQVADGGELDEEPDHVDYLINILPSSLQ
jgi:hypothetical protein